MNLDEIKITPLLDTLRLEKISDSVYFSEPYKNYVSNSRLGLIYDFEIGLETPERFFEGFKPKYSAAFDLGSGTHQLCLQNDLYEVAMTVDKPTAKMGALADRLYPIYKDHLPTSEEIIKEATIVDYYGGNLTQNKIDGIYEKCIPYWESRKAFEESYTGDKELLFFDPKSRETVLNCVTSLKNNNHIQNLLHPNGLIEDPISEMEQAILLDVKVDIPGFNSFILKLKAKLDNYTIDKENNIITVNDVKTIGKIVSEINGNIEKFHYNREFAVYAYLLKLCAEKFYGMKNPTVKGNYLVVSTIPSHYTKVVPMTKDMFKEGFEEFKLLLRLVAKNVTKEEFKDFGIWI